MVEVLALVPSAASNGSAREARDEAGLSLT
jgi:hypothetical protein